MADASDRSASGGSTSAAVSAVRLSMFPLTWRRNLMWIAVLDLLLWVFGLVAFNDVERPQYHNNNVPSCVWRGDNGNVLPYLHHVFRAVFVLSWITYQRNCSCRMHQCCDTYNRCQVITRAVFLIILVLEFIADFALMFVWASTHGDGDIMWVSGPMNNYPMYIPRCGGARMAGFVWLALLMWLTTTAYIRFVVADLQLCGNMMRNRHCCRRFNLVEDPSNAHALQWCCTCLYSSDDEDDEGAPVVHAVNDSDDENSGSHTNNTNTATATAVV